jgi:hypothetical protein
MSICKTLEPTSVQIFNYNLLQRGELHAHLQGRLQEFEAHERKQNEALNVKEK